MKSIFPKAACILFIGIFLVMPAGAVAVRHLDVNIAENGDARITADYTLDWVERWVVYPAALPLVTATTGKEVTIHSVSPEQVILTVRNLAKVKTVPGARIYSTRPYSLSEAGSQLDSAGFGDIVTLDAGTATLRITYPDGYVIEQTDLTRIPSYEHGVDGR